jgi:phosphoribosyl 1,2-cyclic phosphodiesterase
MGGREGALQEVLSGMMRAPIFPVPLDIMHACIAFHDFAAGEVLEPFPGIVLRTAPLNHPNGATGYRVDFAGRSLCYVTDTEHRAGDLDHTIVELIRGSQIVIYDATYTAEEYPHFKGWGTRPNRAASVQAADAGRPSRSSRPGPYRRRPRPRRPAGGLAWLKGGERGSDPRA